MYVCICVCMFVCMYICKKWRNCVGGGGTIKSNSILNQYLRNLLNHNLIDNNRTIKHYQSDVNLITIESVSNNLYYYLCSKNILYMQDITSVRVPKPKYLFNCKKKNFQTTHILPILTSECKLAI